MKKIITILTIICIFLTGCNNNSSNKDNSIQIPTNQNNETTKETEVAEEISEVKIDEEYLNKRYPGKKILTWVYGEGTWLDKETKEYGYKYGRTRLTNLQTVRLNDYLVSKGMDSVICFKKLGQGDKYLKKVDEMIEEGNAPDFIYGNIYYGKPSQKPNMRVMTYDFVGRDLLLDLTPYMDNELKEFSEAFPENDYITSKINGKLYGIDSNFVTTYQYNWYVNTDLAKEYGIDVENMSDMSLNDWAPYFKKVYDGEMKKETKNLKMIDHIWDVIDVRFAKGYIGKLNGLNYEQNVGIGIDNDENKVINYYADEKVKESYRTMAQYINNGYYKFMNMPKEKQKHNTSGNCFLMYDVDVTGGTSKEKEVDTCMYQQLKNVTKVSWCKGKSSNWDWDWPAIVGISNKSNNIQEILKIYNLIYSDKEIANIISFFNYNVGDTDYKINGMEISDFYNENKGKYYWSEYSNWTNNYNAINISGALPGDEIKEIVDSIEVNENLEGRLYDWTPVREQVKRVRKVIKKYIGGNYSGEFSKGDFDTTWNRFLKELEEAGIDDILELANSR